MIRKVSLAVVGANYPNKRGPARRFEIAVSTPGEPVQLIPEPKNPADERAVAVFSCRGVQIGYLTAERCGWIKSLMERGAEVLAIFQHSTDYGAVIRVTIDGSEPILPASTPTVEPAADESDDDIGFCSDPIYDD